MRGSTYGDSSGSTLFSLQLKQPPAVACLPAGRPVRIPESQSRPPALCSQLVSYSWSSGLFGALLIFLSTWV